MTTGNSVAADLFLPEPNDIFIPEARVTDWSGLYAGVHFGGATGLVDVPAPTPPAIGLDDYRVQGWLAGGQIGANAQFDSIVVGAELDAAWSNVSGSGSMLAGVLNVGTDKTIDALGSLRGRIGFAAENFLVYATSGVALAATTGTAWEEFAGVRTDLGTDSAHHLGWALGAGAEVMVTEVVSVKAEYLYHRFGNATYDYGAGSVEDSFDLHTIKVGANFHF